MLFKTKPLSLSELFFRLSAHSGTVWSGDVMSRDMSRAAQPTAVVPPAAAAAEDSVDSNSIVDDDNVSVVSELSEDLALPNTYNYDNYVNDNVNDNIVHRRGPRELNDLGPMQRSPRLRSGKRRE